MMKITNEYTFEDAIDDLTSVLVIVTIVVLLISALVV